MISLDQILLLQQKVESAVAKIQQLEAENDALRKKCSELTNALSSKSELLSSFENDQTQIENGIKKALDRLNSIENSVLKTAGQSFSTPQTTVVTPDVTPVQPVQTIQQSKPVEPATAAQVQRTETIQQPNPVQTNIPSFHNMEEVPVEESTEENNSFDMDYDGSDLESDEGNSEDLGFDIF